MSKSLQEDVLRSMAILIDCGYATYGGYTEDQLISKAEVYAFLCSEHTQITPEIIKETTMRYARGKVTRWKDGCHLPVPYIFPTAPEYVDACLQTHHGLYKMICIGEMLNPEGYITSHCITVRRNIPQEELDALIHSERIRRGLPVPEPSTPLTDAQRHKAKELIRRTFGDEVDL